MAKKNKQAAKTTTVKPPVVTIMGHVDHGKTTLLDYIRKSNLTAREAGGITQGIGAYQIDHNGQKITFIDTPGHAAFSKMRARGASITDIVILIVAADDGVKPQTKESIKHIKQAKVPVIVAVNKIDAPNAVPEMAKSQLVEDGIYVEGYGGDVPVVEISAKEGTNVDKLLETILVLAELEDIKADANVPLQAAVIESSLDKRQGPVASLLITAGTLRQGDEVVSVGLDTDISGKVKRLMTDSGQIVKEAGVSTPVQILGLREVPPAGSIFTTLDAQAQVTESLKDQLENQSDLIARADSHLMENEDRAARTFMVADEEQDKIRIMLVADNAGSLEAIRQNLSDEVELMRTSTGEVTESDIMYAQTTGSVIIAFKAPIARSARKMAQIEKVPVRKYDIIYKLLEDFEQQVMKLLEPTIDEEEIGIAKVLATFNIRDVKITGCRVTSGRLSVKDKIHLRRNDKIIADGSIASLKQGKIDVNQVGEGDECGLVLKPALKVEAGDKITAYKMIED